MADVDPSDASRALQEARTATHDATTAVVQPRWRWALAGGAVFAVSVFAWLAPESSDLLNVVLLVVAVAAFLLARSPRWAGLTGKRAQLTGEAIRRVRTLSLMTMVGVLAMAILVNRAALYLFGEAYPIGGALAGLVLVLAGPRFAQWWITRPGSGA